MTFINSEGKFNENTYLLDAELFKMKYNLAIYIIEHDDTRLMIDTPSELMVRRFIKKLKNFNLYPIHKIILTHSHFDHVQGVEKLKKLIQETDIEVYASKEALKNLKNPEIMNEDYGYRVPPIEDVNPLSEGDFINLGGLKLQILNFFGHTQDSIAILDKSNKNIFVGDAIIDKFDPFTPIPEFVPPDFVESEYLKTIHRLKSLKKELNSICLAHFGAWTGNDFIKIVDEVEQFHFDAKNSIIRWYNENPSLEYIAKKYHEKFTPKSTIHTKENIHSLELLLEWLIEGLKRMGEIE